MNYVCEIEADFCTAPNTDAMGVHYVEFGLGFYPDQDEEAIMSVMLVPRASHLSGKIDGIYDLKFGIRKRHAEHTWKVSAPSFGKEDVAETIDHDKRKLVLQCICQCAAALTKHVEPNDVSMATFYPNLPKIAMRKYDDIIVTLRNSGYLLVDSFDGENGCHYWHFSKPA